MMHGRFIVGTPSHLFPRLMRLRENILSLASICLASISLISLAGRRVPGHRESAPVRALREDGRQVRAVTK
jgi:hypothetical protein